jgi:hypothetical protein
MNTLWLQYMFSICVTVFKCMYAYMEASVFTLCTRSFSLDSDVFFFIWPSKFDRIRYKVELHCFFLFQACHDSHMRIL